MGFQRQDSRNKIQSLVHIYQCGRTLPCPTTPLWATLGPSKPFLQFYDMMKDAAGNAGGYAKFSTLPYTTDSNILQRIPIKIDNTGINVDKV